MDPMQQLMVTATRRFGFEEIEQYHARSNERRLARFRRPSV